MDESMTFKDPEHLSVLLQYTSYHYSLIGLALILGVGFTLTINRFINNRSELTLPFHTTLLLVLAGGFLAINTVLFVLGLTRLFNGQAMIIAFSLLSILSVAVCFVESRAFLSLLKPNI